MNLASDPVASIAEPPPGAVDRSRQDFVELEARAVRQWEAIEERGRALVMQTFSMAALRAE